MKKSKYLLSMSIVSISILYAGEIKINNKEIVRKAVAIEKMMQRHKYIVAGFTAIGCIQQLSYWLPVLSSGAHYFFDDATTTITTDIPSVCRCKTTETEKQLGFFSSIAQDTHNLFATAAGWRRIFDSGMYLTGQIGAFVLFQKISESVDHVDNLRWYVSTYVPYAQTLDIIERLARSLSFDDSLSAQQRVHCRRVLYRSCVQLSGYAEDICAYMVYKSILLPKNQKLCAEGIERYFLNYHNDVIEQIFTIIHQNAPEYGDLIRLIDAYRAELKYQKKLFASVEGEQQNMIKNFNW